MMYYNTQFNNQSHKIYLINPDFFDTDLKNHSFFNISRISSSRGQVIEFSSPVFFTLEHDENGHYAKNTELNVFAYGKNSLELRDDIVEEIIGQWRLYANELDEYMTDDAIAIKNNLRKMVVFKESTISNA